MYNCIKIILNQLMNSGKDKIVIYPFGNVGHQIKNMLNDEFGIREFLLLDDRADYDNAHTIDYLDDNPLPSDAVVVIATFKKDIRSEKRELIRKYVNVERIVELSPLKDEELVEIVAENRDFDSQSKILRLSNGVRFYLPLYNVDVLQQGILLNDRYYEDEILYFLKTNYGNKLKGKSAVDIGANIGNHSLFFVKEEMFSRVDSFEPIRETYDILTENIIINDCGNVIIPHNVALGEKEGRGERITYNVQNIGGTCIGENDGGEFVISTLDSFNLEDIGLIKIDVEGFEEKVIKGAIETIKRWKPIILLESFDESGTFDGICNNLLPLGYRVVPLTVSDYIFAPSE